MKSNSSTEYTQSTSHFNYLLEDIIDKLYKSGDPLCIEAGTAITKSYDLIKFYQKELDKSDNQLIKQYKASAMLLDSLTEIVKLSIERDNPKKKLTEIEFQKRFREIIFISTDAYFSYERIIDGSTETLRKQ